jgi:large subunit ribosomal protein L29
MKAQEIREMSSDEIERRVEEEERELDKLRFNHAVAPLDNSMVLRNKRRDIARMKTILREREMAEAKD